MYGCQRAVGLSFIFALIMPTETETIDIYCERLDPSFWAEPINALTNLAFIAVGFWVLRGIWPRGTCGIKQPEHQF